MAELSLNSPEVHESWLLEARRRMRMNYQDIRNFSESSNIDCLSVFWFFKGCPVEEDAFKAICNVLAFDWEAIQQPYLGLPMTLKDIPEQVPFEFCPESDGIVPFTGVCYKENGLIYEWYRGSTLGVCNKLDAIVELRLDAPMQGDVI